MRKGPLRSPGCRRGARTRRDCDGKNGDQEFVCAYREKRVPGTRTRPPIFRRSQHLSDGSPLVHPLHLHTVKNRSSFRILPLIMPAASTGSSCEPFARAAALYSQHLARYELSRCDPRAMTPFTSNTRHERGSQNCSLLGYPCQIALSEMNCATLRLICASHDDMGHCSCCRRVLSPYMFSVYLVHMFKATHRITI